MNAEISNIIKKTKQNFKYMKIKQTNDSVKLYKDTLSQKKNMIQKSIRLSQWELANKSKDFKEFFKYFNNLNKTQRVIGPLKKNNIIAESDIDIAEMLNDHFSSVFTIENTDNFPQNYKLNSSKCIEHPFKDFLVTKEEVEILIDNLNENKSPGPDEIHPILLKSAPKSFSCALSIIYNRSITFGEVPIDWKLANISPVFKKGDKTDPNNYRPISLTSIICKIFEKIIREKISEHLAKNNLITNSQHGFSKGKSCLTNLIEFFDIIMQWYDDDNPIDILYLDFEKAFDKVEHNKLLLKLKTYGFSEQILIWLKHWLIGRKQRTQLNGKRSKWTDVLSGTPQGTVLAATLFIIYIDDIDDILIKFSILVKKIADDTKLGKKINCYNDAFEFQKAIDLLTNWAEKWNMNFNVKKCKIIHIGSKNINFNYEINNDWLPIVDQENDLGVIVSSDLKNSAQCISAKNKANKMLGIINRGISYKSEDVIRKLYTTYVRPLLEYCVQFWSPYLIKDIDMIESVQRRATKMIPSLKKLSYEKRLEKLNLFSLKKRRLRGDMIELYKMIHGIDQVNLNQLFIFSNDRYKT